MYKVTIDGKEQEFGSSYEAAEAYSNSFPKDERPPVAEIADAITDDGDAKNPTDEEKILKPKNIYSPGE